MADPAPTAPPGVVLAGVSHTFATAGGDVQALRGIDVTFAPATSTAIVGRSGSGKSTLVSILALLRRPTQGQVSIWGTDTATLSDAQVSRIRGEQVGVVFQSFHLDGAASALENVLLPWYFQAGLSRRRAIRSATEKLDLLGIADLAGRRPGEMSGGQRQRVAVARALLTEPKLLIADEPTGNLDEATAGTIARQIFSLASDLGSAVVVVTHDSEVAALADRQVRIHAGVLAGEFAGEGES